jgi:ABC-type nickel/cobalt efflux system permease component RcnA
VKRDRGPAPPPPLEANDQLVAVVGTAAWAVALVVLLIVRSELAAGARWWIWTCVAGLVMGLFALWYVPRLKRSRARSAARRAQDREQGQPEGQAEDQSAPRASGSNTVSSTETPGKSTRS